MNMIIFGWDMIVLIVIVKRPAMRGVVCYRFANLNNSKKL